MNDDYLYQFEQCWIDNLEFNINTWPSCLFANEFEMMLKEADGLQEQVI